LIQAKKELAIETSTHTGKAQCSLYTITLLFLHSQ